MFPRMRDRKGKGLGFGLQPCLRAKVPFSHFRGIHRHKHRVQEAYQPLNPQL